MNMLKIISTLCIAALLGLSLSGEAMAKGAKRVIAAPAENGFDGSMKVADNELDGMRGGSVTIGGTTFDYSYFQQITTTNMLTNVTHTVESSYSTATIQPTDLTSLSTTINSPVIISDSNMMVQISRTVDVVVHQSTLLNAGSNRLGSMAMFSNVLAAHN